MTFSRRERDEFDVLFWVLAAAVVVAIIVGLIEFNARRQAAAMTREMLRPATPEEQQAINDSLRQIDANMPPVVIEQRSAYDTAPLRPGERCLSHQRFARVSNGWVQIGTCE